MSTKKVALLGVAFATAAVLAFSPRCAFSQSASGQAFPLAKKAGNAVRFAKLNNEPKSLQEVMEAKKGDDKPFRTFSSVLDTDSVKYTIQYSEPKEQGAGDAFLTVFFKYKREVAGGFESEGMVIDRKADGKVEVGIQTFGTPDPFGQAPNIDYGMSKTFQDGGKDKKHASFFQKLYEAILGILPSVK